MFVDRVVTNRFVNEEGKEKWLNIVGISLNVFAKAGHIRHELDIRTEKVM